MKLSHIANRIKRLFNEDYISKPLVPKEGMCIQEFLISGIQYEGRENIVKQLTLTDDLKLKRDKNNEHDKNAIRIVTNDEKTIGYLPRDIAKILASVNDEILDFKCTIIQLGKDSENKIFNVRIAVSLPEELMTTTISSEFEFVMDRGSKGDLYVLLNCKSDKRNDIINQLKKSGFGIEKWGSSTKPATISDDRQYQWYIKLMDTVKEINILEFFNEFYNVQPWKKIADLRKSIINLKIQKRNSRLKRDKLYTKLNFKQETINELKKDQEQEEIEFYDEFSRFETRIEKLNEENNDLKTKIKKERKNMIEDMLPGIRLCRDSLKVICDNFPNQKETIKKLEKLQFPEIKLNHKPFHASKNWFEISNQGKNPIRIYYKLNKKGKNDVLVSYKKHQANDAKWMKKY